jgi:hypothetical protein
MLAYLTSPPLFPALVREGPSLRVESISPWCFSRKATEEAPRWGRARALTAGDPGRELALPPKPFEPGPDGWLSAPRTTPAPPDFAKCSVAGWPLISIPTPGAGRFSNHCGVLAAELAGQHGVFRTAQVLRLDYNTMVPAERRVCGVDSADAHGGRPTVH